MKTIRVAKEGSFVSLRGAAVSESGRNPATYRLTRFPPKWKAEHIHGLVYEDCGSEIEMLVVPEEKI